MRAGLHPGGNAIRRDDMRSVASLYGGFWSHDVRDFCYMTNPYFPPQGFLEALGLRLRELVKAYPSTNWYLSALLAEPLALTHEQLVVSNGASELIAALTERFVDHLAVPVPTFDEFINRAKTAGKLVSPYPLDEDFHLDVEGFVRHVREAGADTAVIIQPNNPTGTLVPRDELLYLLDELRHLRLVVLDESFLDFATGPEARSLLDELEAFPNLLVMKSLSKVCGIPGLRLGYAACANREVIGELRRRLPIWSINSLAQYFIEGLPAYAAEFRESCARVREATRELVQGLRSVPCVEPYPTHGNFVLCRLGGDLTGPELAHHLFDRFRILVNDCSRKAGLDERAVRFASRTLEENLELVGALREVVPGTSRADDKTADRRWR